MWLLSCVVSCRASTNPAGNIAEMHLQFRDFVLLQARAYDAATRQERKPGAPVNFPKAPHEVIARPRGLPCWGTTGQQGASSGSPPQVLFSCNILKSLQHVCCLVQLNLAHAL